MKRTSTFTPVGHTPTLVSERSLKKSCVAIAIQPFSEEFTELQNMIQKLKGKYALSWYVRLADELSHRLSVLSENADIASSKLFLSLTNKLNKLINKLNSKLSPKNPKSC
jgi:hypothetical protein